MLGIRAVRPGEAAGLREKVTLVSPPSRGRRLLEARETQIDQEEGGPVHMCGFPGLTASLQWARLLILPHLYSFWVVSDREPPLDLLLLV